MKLFTGLFGRKPEPIPSREPEFDIEGLESLGADVEPLVLDAQSAVTEPAPEPEVAPAPAPVQAEVPAAVEETPEIDLPEMPQIGIRSVNIWDLEEDEETDSPAEAQPAAPSRAATRRNRNRTRLIGFDKSDGDVVDLFDETPAVAPSSQAMFPVGWLLVVDGEGRGNCFSLVSGMSQIGRGEDQAIRLDFGDTAISRNNHAAIVYDADTRKFILGHGGKANIVRLNGQPVISNEDLSDGDRIKIGSTTIQLKVLCGADFDWSNTQGGEERDDVAIA